MTRALGTDDSINTCDCCGKTNLKFTVAIELDDGDIVHYGQICARRNTGKNQRTITSEIKAHADAVQTAATAEYRASAEYKAECARFAERDEFARKNGVRMVGTIAMEFVSEACDAAQTVRNAIAAKHGISPWSIRA